MASAIPIELMSLVNTKGKNRDMSLLGDRLTIALQFKGVSQTELAEAIGVKPQSIQAICANKVKKTRFAYEISEFLGINPAWLSHGEGAFTTKVSEQNNEGHNQKTSESISELSWKDLQNHKPQSLYSLRVEDDSMTPKFEDGYLLVIDPSKEPSNKDYVIIKNNRNEVLVRQFIKTQTTSHYRAFSEGYNLTYSDEIMEILGVVVETRISFYDR